MGKTIVTIADHTAEVSTVTFPGSDLTALNFDAELALIATLRTALGAVQRGLELKYSIVAKVSPQAVGRSADEEAQREEKALVRFYDSVTFERATLEIPCADMGLQNPNHPGVFYLDGAPDNEAVWDTFVTAFEAYVSGPGGNAPVVEEVIHVGRKL